MKNVLIVSFSEVNRDPRVMRQIEALEKQYRLCVASFGSKPAKDVEFVQIKPNIHTRGQKLWKAFRMLLGMYSSVYWQNQYVRDCMQALAGRHFDLVIANDLSALPVLKKLFPDVPIYFDAHEYYPEELSGLFWKLTMGRYYKRICRKYLRETSQMTTVCEGIAEKYRKNFQVSPGIVLNAPKYHPLAPKSLDVKAIRLIHHGGALAGRGLEEMIDLMKLLDQRFTLDLMLVGEGTYKHSLMERAKFNQRINFPEPVRMPEIVSTINRYDVGLYLLQPSSFNNAYALPNKFFEFIQAHLALAVGPSPEMAKIVRKYDIGVVAKSFAVEDLAQSLNALRASEIARFKANTERAARNFNAEQSQSVMRSIVQETISAGAL